MKLGTQLPTRIEKRNLLQTWLTAQGIKSVASTILSVAAISFTAGHANAESPSATESNGEILVTTAVQQYCPPVNSCGPCDPYYAPAQSESTPAGQYDAASPSDLPPGEEFQSAPTTTPEMTDFGSNQNFDAPVSNQNFNSPAANTIAATSLAATTGSRGGLDAPNMLGDLPGFGATVIVDPDGPGGSPGVPYTVPSAGLRRFKVTENVSPIPQDRVFFNYNHFDDALQASATSDTYFDRYIFGGEKTFIDGLFSIEMRILIGDGFDSTQTAARERGTEFGDLQFAFKSLLYSSNNLFVGGGTTLSVPTADDAVIIGVGTIENESVFLAPFLGFIGKTTERTFVQGFLQSDIVLGGDTVLDAGGAEVGTYQDQNLIYASLSTGYWLYRNDSRNASLSGVAGLLEFHYTSALNDADTVTANPGVAGEAVLTSDDNFDVLNLTSGLVFQAGKSYFRVGGSVPLSDDEFYDSEFQFQINRRF